MAVLKKIQELLDQVVLVKEELSALGIKPNQTNIREALANTTRKYMTDIDRSVVAIDDTVMNGNYPVPIRIYHPEPGTALPIAVFIHGGGHMSGSITVYDGIVRKMAKQIKHIIIAIDYRLAPEFPYPTALQDCKMAIRYIFKILDERKISFKEHKLTIIGDSAGGNLCASIVMDKEFVAVEQINKQVLIYPSLDYTMSLPSVNEFAKGYFLEKEKMEWYFANYFQGNVDRRAKSPVYNEFYPKMPKTLIFAALYDPLQDEAELYYTNMLKVGAEAELIKVEGVVHAYLMLEDLCKEECNKTYQIMNEFLN